MVYIWLLVVLYWHYLFISDNSFCFSTFFAYELGRKDFCQLRHTFSMIFIVYIIIVLAILFIAETLGLWFLNNVMTIPVNRLEAANWVYQFALLSFIVKILTNPYNAVIIARENMKIYAYVSIVEAFLKLLIVYLLVVFAIDKLKLYAVLTFAVTCIVSAIYVLFCFKNMKNPEFHYFGTKHFSNLFSHILHGVCLEQWQELLIRKVLICC